MTTRVMLRVDSYVDEYITATLFAGEGEALAKIGTLTMCVGEYQAIGCALLMGAERMGTQLQVITDDTVFLAERERRAALEVDDDDAGV